MHAWRGADTGTSVAAGPAGSPRVPAAEPPRVPVVVSLVVAVEAGGVDEVVVGMLVASVVPVVSVVDCVLVGALAAEVVVVVVVVVVDSGVGEVVVAPVV